MNDHRVAQHWVRSAASGDRGGDRRVTLTWPERFLVELAQSGDELAACRVTGVTKRAALELRWSTRAFALAWDRALVQARDLLHARVLAAVLESSTFDHPGIAHRAHNRGAGEL